MKDWAQRLPEGGYLIIDEAFIDLTPEQSVLQQHFCDNMLVLRSFGKFFGLAGIRLGFVFANAMLRQHLQERIGLWTVNGPAQEVAIAALRDSAWQSAAQLKIRRSASVTQEKLQPLFEQPTGRVYAVVYLLSTAT